MDFRVKRTAVLDLHHDLNPYPDLVLRNGSGEQTKELSMNANTIKPNVIALVALAVAASATAASAATKLSASGCCPLCR